jgi:hypothetical protein
MVYTSLTLGLEVLRSVQEIDDAQRRYFSSRLATYMRAYAPEGEIHMYEHFAQFPYKAFAQASLQAGIKIETVQELKDSMDTLASGLERKMLSPQEKALLEEFGTTLIAGQLQTACY